MNRLAGGPCAVAAPVFLYSTAIATAAIGAWLAGGGRLGAGAPILVGSVILLGLCHRRGRRLAVQARRDHGLAAVHLSAIEALALAIDAKDKTASTHIRRVQRYAGALARAAGMTDDEVLGVTTAALLHDIGKLAVPEHILSKPGPLTYEEFQKIHIHPQVGFEIIEHVPFPYPVAPLILCHHERWTARVSARPAGDGHPARRAGAGDLRLLRLAHARPPLPQGRVARDGRRRSCARRPARRSTPR